MSCASVIVAIKWSEIADEALVWEDARMNLFRYVGGHLPLFHGQNWMSSSKPFHRDNTFPVMIGSNHAYNIIMSNHAYNSHVPDVENDARYA
jgi:hypothetical protein